MSCDICGEVPRSIWTFAGGWWRWYGDEKVCPGCSLWLSKFGLGLGVV